MRLSKIAWRNTSHGWPLGTLNNIPGHRLRFSWRFFRKGHRQDIPRTPCSRRRLFVFSASCALVFLLSCLIALLTIWARTNKTTLHGKIVFILVLRNLEEPSIGAKIRNRNRWTNVTCLQLQIWSVDAVQDGRSLTITRINALKYNDIHNQIQPPYYSNGF